MVDRSIRVTLHANTAGFIQAMRSGDEAIKSFARQGVEAKKPYIELEAQLKLAAKAARDLGTAGNAIGKGFGEAAPKVEKLVAAVGRIGEGDHVNKLVSALGAMAPEIERIMGPLRDLRAEMRGVRLPAGGLAGAAAMRSEIEKLQAQIEELRRVAGRPIPLGPPSPAGGTGEADSAAASRSRGVVGNGLVGSFLKYQVGYAAITAVGTAIGSTIKQTADFETQLNVLGAVTKSTATPALAAASKKALELGADFTITGANAADAAQTMTELAKGGLSVSDAMTAAKGTMQLASAGSVSFTQAADIQTSAMASFSLGADQATRVADNLANTANAVRGNIGDFAAGLRYAGTTAHQVGYTLEETTAVLALFAKNGLTGSMGGTVFKEMLLKLEHPSKAATGAIKELGIQVYDSNHNFIKAPELANDLAAAHKRLGNEAFNAATATVFAARAVQGASVLAKDGGVAVTDLANKTLAGAGAAAFSAAKMQGLGGAFLNLQNQVETAQVTLGEKFSPALQKVVKGVADAVPVVTSFLTGSSFSGGLSAIGNWFRPLIDGAKNLVSTVWPYVSTFIGSLSRGFSSVVTFVKPVVDAIGGFFTSISKSTATKQLGTALDAVGRAFESVLKWVEPVGKAIGTIITFAGNLPGPIWLGVAALGAFLLLRGPITGMVKSIRQELVMATYGMGTFAFATRSVGASAALMGKGLLSALGGPVGIAITGVTIGLGYLFSAMSSGHQSSAQVKEDTDALTSSLDANTGAITDNTRATLVDQLQKDGTLDKVKAAGINVADYTDAILGNAAAQQRVAAETTVAIGATIGASDQYKKIKGDLDAAKISTYDLAQATQSGDWSGVTAKFKAYGATLDPASAAMQRFNGDQVSFNGLMHSGADIMAPYRDLTGITATEVGKLGDAHAAVATKIDAANSALALNADNAREATRTYSGLGAALTINVTDSLKGVGDAAHNAGFDMSNFYTVVTDKPGGPPTIVTKLSTDFANYNAAVTAAQTTTDQFMLALDRLAGRDVSVQQALEADSAAVAATGAALRAKIQNQIDQRKAQSDYSAAQANLNKTNKDGTRASDATTTDDITAAKLRLDDANAKVLGSQDQINQAYRAEEKTAATLEEQDARTTRARGGSWKAIADAADKAQAAEHKRFVDNAIANGVARKDAEKLADSFIGAAGSASKLLAQTPAFAPMAAGAAKVAAELDAAAKDRTLHFHAHAEEANQILATYQGNVDKIPANVKTKFDADIVNAHANGQSLYEVYNKTTGNWEAKFLTPTAAAAKAKAGDLVKEYDTAKGTWTAQLTANDLASDKINGVKSAMDGVKDKTVKLSVEATSGLSLMVGGSEHSGSGAASGAQNHATGGRIHGSGSGTSDDVPIWASDGEFMHTAADYRRNRGAVEYIHAGGTIDGYATGGQINNGRLGGLNVQMNESGSITGALATANGILAGAQRTADSMNAAAAAAAAFSAGSSGLLGSQDPSAWGWQVASNIVPYSFNGIGFPSGVAGGTAPIWNAFLQELVPMIPGGIRPGDDWGFDNRNNVNSPGQKSFHAYGLALDVNAEENPNGSLPGSGKYQVPVAAGPLASKYNMLWGGNFSGVKDPMHFELHQRPGGAVAGAILGAVNAVTGAIGSMFGGGNAGTAPIQGGPQVARWRPLADKVYQDKGYPVSLDYVMLNQMAHESSGDPNAIQLTDINAQEGHPSVGLLQFIPTTFAANADPGYNTNIYDPESQMHAFLNYVARNYGGLTNFAARNYVAYAQGGPIHGPGHGTSDDVPMFASGGEFMHTAKDYKRNKGAIDYIHAGGTIDGYATGGPVLPNVWNVAGHGGSAPPDAGPILAAVLAAVGKLAGVVTTLDLRLLSARSANEQAAASASTARRAQAAAAAAAAAAAKNLTSAQSAASAAAAAKIATAENHLADVRASNAAAALAAQQRFNRADNIVGKARNEVSIQAARDHIAAVAEANARRLTTAENALNSTRTSSTAHLTAAQKAVVTANTKLATANANVASTAEKAHKAAAAFSAQLAQTTAVDRLQRAYRSTLVLQEHYANNLDILTNKMTTAQATLDQLKSSRASTVSSVAQTVSTFDGGITGHPDTRNTFDTILKGQQYDLAKAHKFQTDLAALKRLGLGSSAINQIASAGIDGGGATAAALATSSKAQIAQLNSVESKLSAQGTAAGNTVGDAMYGAGIHAAQGLVNGIRSQENALRAAMNHLANSVIADFKHALGIHSPSTVFHELGGHTVSGYVNGINAHASRANTALKNMVQVPEANVPRIAPGGYSAAGHLGDIHVYVGNHEIKDIVKVEIGGHTRALTTAFRNRKGQA